MQDNFTFTINESLFFDKEQQIKEMLGIGIEPVISIEEADNSLSIRGVMELKGEYVKDESLNSEDHIERNSELQFVEKVDRLSDEVNEFFHKLLVDITIPSERIHSAEDVELEIDHFDYKLKSNQEMLIETTLLIHGIREKEVEEEMNDQEPLPLFELERNESGMLEEKEEEAMDEVEVLEREEKEELEESQENQEETAEEKVVADEQREEDKEEDREENSERTEPEIKEMPEEVRETNEIDLNEEIESEEDTDAENEEERENKEEEKLQVRAQTSTDDEAKYLLNIFENEESTRYRKLKLYIVQPNDEIERIASRYEVTPRQIIRTNQLEDEYVSPGQLIYIPVNEDKK